MAMGRGEGDEALRNILRVTTQEITLKKIRISPAHFTRPADIHNYETQR
jgi:hypothetical protein